MADLDALTLAALGVAALVAAAVHGALGFGSGPLLAGVLLAALAEPGVAVAAVLLAAVGLNGLVLRPEPGAGGLPRRLLATAATFLAVSVAALAGHALLAGPAVVGEGALVTLALAPALVAGGLAGVVASRRVGADRRRTFSLVAAALAALVALAAAAA